MAGWQVSQRPVPGERALPLGSKQHRPTFVVTRTVDRWASSPPFAAHRFVATEAVVAMFQGFLRGTCLTGDTVSFVAEASVRDLRNHGGAVLERVLRGERITVTRDGIPVAELRPLPGGRLSGAALVERFRALPPVDATRFRADVDAVVDQAL